jgi:hypothetical protein
MRKININHIHIIIDLFSYDELTIIYKILQENQWKIDSNNNKYIEFGNISEVKELMYEKKIVLIKEMEKDFNTKIKDETISNVVEYSKGWSLPEHIDNWDKLPTPSGQERRDISSSMYFTQDFLGGELVFPNQGISIQPIAGSAVYFPSTERYPHYVSEIAKGKRWVCTSFWNTYK